MNIYGTSMVSDLAVMATNNAHQQIQNQVLVSVLRQQMEIQKTQGATLVKMIHDTTLDGTGQIVNLGA